MLLHLRILDLAIIDEVELALAPGLNVLTGETGAGKSIIVGAASLLRGGRGAADLVRGGCQEAVVEALFDVTGQPRVARGLERAGLPPPSRDGRRRELLLRRVVSRSGRGRVYVNGALCTLTTLGELTRNLLDIAGQHEHQLLSDRSTHRRLLDAIGVPDEELAAMEQIFARLEGAASALARVQMDERERTTRVDFLRFQLQELVAAQLRPDEEGELERARLRLQRAAELRGAAVDGEQELYSAELSVTDRLARLRRLLEGLAVVDARLQPLAAQLEEARLLLEDVALSLRRYSDGVELDPAQLNQVEERLEVIHRLKRKHGGSTAQILARQAAMRAELEELETLDERVATLGAELEAARRDAERTASRLSEARAKAARDLGAGVTAHLTRLRMSGARLEVQLSPRLPREGDDGALCVAGRRLGASGWDRVEFLITTNPGEEPRSLARTASGGELSRVMLALRQVLGRHDPVATSIYDEVDAGIGGAAADAVGRALAAVARHRQVLCVTHLPQVAAHADHHLHVGKTSGRGKARAHTELRALAGQDRVDELARMLGGQQVTDEARANARQLLDAAAKKKTTVDS
jgi:DNA repair protein RecN (Recombination protein N)